MNTKFWLGNLNGSDHSEGVGVYGKIILECLLGNLAQDRDKWRSLVNIVMNLQVP
jgi:hypothetical protein